MRLITEYIIPPILAIEIILLNTPPPNPNNVKAPLITKFSNQFNISVVCFPLMSFSKSSNVYYLIY